MLDQTSCDRRALMLASLGLAMTSLITPPADGSQTASPLPQSPLPPPPPGNPGDFDFLTGEWRIANRFREDGRWIEFPGEATVVGILGGIASVEELRIPARGFSGMGLRLLDVERRIWSDHWVNARSGVVTVPGQTGGFVDGVGTFISRDGEGEEMLLYRGVWDSITPTSCRWFQGASRDGGRSWDDSWFMDWTRVG